MILTECLSAITKAAGRELTADETKQLSRELDRKARAIRANDTALSLEDAALQAADEVGKSVTLAAAIEKRNAAINLKKRADALAFISASFADNPALGLRSILTGSQRARVGARSSVAAEQEQLAGHYFAGLFADLERTGDLALLSSGSSDRDIARALWKLDDEVPDFAGLMPEAVEIAKVMRKWQEVARIDANKAGAWIGKLPGYIVRQSHDMWEIQRSGPDAWKAEILPKLDLARMAVDIDDIDEYLSEVYTGLATGQHLKTSPDPKAAAFKGPANLAKRVSQERVLHFKSADDWFDYNAKFGGRNLRESLFAGLERSAESTGLMRRLGTNPDANFDQIVDDIAKGLRRDPKKLAEFVSDVGTAVAPGPVRNRLLEVNGSTKMPINNMAARVSAGIRTVETTSGLGAAMISSFTDVPVYASEMRYQGRGFLSGMADAIGGLLTGRPKGEQREILFSLGVVFDSMRGNITRWGAHDDSFPGALSRMQQVFFKLNLQHWWTESLLGSAALSMAHDLGQHMGKAFGELRPELTRVLSLYGITEADWGALTTVAARTAEDGRAYLTPELAKQIADDAVPGIAEGPTAAKRRNTYRSEIEAKLRTFYVDRTRTAVLHPDAETLALMRRGSRPGTWFGESARFIGQYKSFSISYLQKIIGREVYGRGADTLGEAMRNGHGEMVGLANIILWSTAFGYGAMTVKDLLKGRDPRQPEDAASAAKIFAAAMVQGGGLGIYGDFLFGQSNRFGGGLLSTVAGPVAGTANDFFDLYQRVKAGDDVAAQAFRVGINNTPFMNLFWTRTALDYFVLYRIQEALNPGYLRRMERRVERENRQTFWLPPSEAVR